MNSPFENTKFERFFVRLYLLCLNSSKKYFHVEQQKTKTVLLTQIAALTAIDNKLNGATRVISSESVRELQDSAIFFSLESELEKNYSSAMTQATIIISIWEARYLVGAEQFYFSISRGRWLARLQLVNDEPDIVSGAAKHCMHGITQWPFEPVAPQLAIILHVADGRFDSASALDHRLEATRDAASLT